jgi:hypothetical protein
VSTGAALGLRVSLALGLVLGLLWVAARLMRGRTGGRAGHAVEVLAPRPSGARPAEQGPLAGSILSPATWQKTVEALRERTVRRG